MIVNWRGRLMQLRKIATLADNRVLLAGLFVLILCRYYLIEFLGVFSPELVLDTRRTVSGAEALGFIAIAVVLKDLNSDRVLRWWDIAAITCIVIGCLHQSFLLGMIGVTCLGLLFIVRKDKRLVSLGQLCIGLAWVSFWGPIVLKGILQWLLPIETALAYWPLHFFGPFSIINGNIIDNGHGHGLQLIGACSAFQNTITTTFIWLSLIKIQKLEFQRQHVYILAIALAAVITLNEIRICMMAISMTQYLFWHYGPGLFIVKAIMLSVVFGLFCFCLRRDSIEPTRQALSPSLNQA
jgi:hypothetical protein